MIVMRSFKSLAGVLVAPILLASTSYACIRPAHIVGALDAVQIACVLVSDMVEDEHKLAQICGVAEEMLPEIRKVVLARKTAAAHKATVASNAPSASAASTAPCAPAPSAKAQTSTPASTATSK